MKNKLRCAAWWGFQLASGLLAVAAHAQTSVSSLAPAAAAVGSTVVITGSGFADAGAQNAVYFGAARATVAAATATQLTVRVPAGASSVVPITVTNLTTGRLGSSLASGTPLFTLLFAGAGLNAASYQATSYLVATSRTGSEALASADFNADNHPDFAVVADGGLALVLSDGAGGYDSPVVLAAGNAPSYVRAADVDANGTADLLVVAGPDLLLFRNLGGGRGFATAAPLNLGGRQLSSSFYGVSTVEVQDTNADGRPDLLLTLGSELVELRGNGTGFEAPAVLFTDSRGSLSQAVADFTQDGRLDVLLVSRNSPSGYASLLLLARNAANTGYESPVAISLGTSTSLYGYPLLADVNADGQLDVVSRGQVSSSEGLLVMLRTATGFALPTALATGLSNNALQAVTDTDGDGRPDFLLTGRTGFSVVRGQAGGGAAPAISYGTAGGGLTTGDFDQDGRTDVATFDVGSGNLTVFRYTGASPNTNSPPTLNALADLAVDEDAPTQVVALGGIGNGGEPGQAITLTAVSSDPNLVPNPTIAYFSPTSTGTLRLRPAPNAFGTCTITVTASDGQAQNGTITRTFRVTVNPVNDAPTLDPIPDVVITDVTTVSKQLTTLLSGITAGAGNENQILSLSALTNVSGYNQGTFAYTSPSPTGQYQVEAYIYGGLPRLIGSVTITVSDGQPSNGTTSQTFRVYYNPGGTAPNQPAASPTLDTPADVTASRTLATQVPVALAGIGDGDPGQVLPLTVTATSSDPDLVSMGTPNYTSPAATGTLPYTISSTRGGTALVSVTVRNGQAQNGSITRSFRVVVPAAAVVTATRSAGGVEFSLYPNPAVAGRFQLASPAPGPLDVTVFDLTGRVVLARRLAAGQAAQVIELPAATAPGTYLVRVGTAQGTAVRRLTVE